MIHAKSQDELQYRLTRVKTEAATGYFDCLPVGDCDYEEALAQARCRPNDEFMRKHLLRLIAGWGPEAFKARIQAAAGAGDAFLSSLFFEACLLIEPFSALRRHFPARLHARLADASPLIVIDSHRRKDQRLHRRWIDLLGGNIWRHVPLPAKDTIPDLRPPVSQAAVQKAMAAPRPLSLLAGQLKQGQPAGTKPEAAAGLTGLALERLALAGVAVGPEMRHTASLSPIALMRQWEFSVRVACDRHRFRLSGEQISYGRGLDLEAARVACVMEIVERVSAYAAIETCRASGYLRDYPLTRARLSELRQRRVDCLDPNRLCLEVPYKDEPLYWLEGRTAAAAGGKVVLVPAQCVFLFCNLDEKKLFSALGSNGLGAGATQAQATVQALLEVIERDSEAVVPFAPALRFDVECREPRIARLLQSYADRGIHLGFLDITGPLGVPCCKCTVTWADGAVAAGTGAHLDARRALLSALTETPYPYPDGPLSRPLPPAGVRVPLENLPDYDRGDPEANLELLETLLTANGYEPIYVDLTRRDLELPVVRAIVPGMEMMGDFDRFSRIHPRLYGHYLKHAG